MKRILVTLPLAALLAAPLGAQGGFDHLKHQRVFPSCIACHQGAENPDAEMWPRAESCTACHDGTLQPRVSWQPPAEPHPSNLKFVHDLVPLMTRRTAQGTATLSCGDCHIAAGGSWMAVRRAAPEGCIGCHAPGTTHLTAPDTVCATCHLTLVRATTLRRADIAGFPLPPSHRQPGFTTREGHGALARATTEAVAPSCAVCHARDFCMTCHVDAPEQAAIQALEPDPRARAIVVRLQAPPTHRDPTFLQRHPGGGRGLSRRAGRRTRIATISRAVTGRTPPPHRRPARVATCAPTASTVTGPTRPRHRVTIRRTS